jgi:hypothetical protein
MSFATRYAGSEAEPTVTSELVGHVASKFSDNAGPIKPLHASTVKLQRLDTYKLDTDGKALTKATAVFDGTDQPVWQGSATSGSLPWECAVVVSLNANGAGYDPHAARKRGRFYLPPPSTDTLAGDGNGRLATGKVDTFKTTWATILEAVNDIPSGLASQCRLIVASKVASANYDVVSLHVDDRVDVQRRRENRQADSYSNSYTFDA